MGELKIRKRIGILFAQPDSKTHKEMIKGITTEAFKYDYDILFFATAMRNGGSDEYRAGERHAFDMMNFELLDGVIIVPDVIQIDGLLDELEQSIRENFDGPVLLINSEKEGYLHAVSNTFFCMSLIIDHLCSVHNCKDFVLFMGPEKHEHSIQREKSALKALAERGISVDKGDIYYGDFWYGVGDSVAEDILARRGREHLPEAVVCANDPMAVSLIDGFKKRGVRVPEDVIVTGYDSLSAIQPKSITSVELNNFRLGQEAVRKVVATLGVEIETDADDESWGKMVYNNTCGCETNVEYEMVYKEQFETGYYDGNDFFAGYNFMNEILHSSTDLNHLLWNILYVAKSTKYCDAFYICLNEAYDSLQTGGKDVDLDKLDYSRLSDTMYLAMESKVDGDVMNVEFDRSFDLKDILPEIHKPQDKPHIYYFNLIHFNEKLFGYSVIAYSDPMSTFDKTHAYLMRTNALAFESVRKQYTLRLLYKKIEESAIMDQSTGLYSRNGFNLYSDNMLERARNYKYNFALIIGDLNCLKYINDTFGHSFGDIALRVAADAIKTELELDKSGTQMNFRIGGDEFVQIIVGKFTENDIKKHIEVIRKKLEDYNKNSELKFPVLMSLGYCILKPKLGDKIDSIMIKADDMMFADKKRIKEETGFDFKRS